MKIFTGKVISNRMAKTSTVAVERMIVHPLYGKRYKKIQRYHVHDETGSAIGQIIKFVASGPKSKLKKWKKIIIPKSESVKSTPKPSSQKGLTKKAKATREVKKQ